MNADIDSILDGLQDIGTIINAPAGSADVELLEKTLHVKMHAYLREVYARCNGFQTQVAFGFMALWSLEDILKNASDASPDSSTKRLYAIGDFLIGSDLLQTSLEDIDTPITFRCEGRVLAPNLPEFFRKLVLGEFKF